MQIYFSLLLKSFILSLICYSSMNEKRESVIRRRTLVKSRPDSIKATAKEQAYSSDDLSPETNPESPKLIDLSALPEPQEKVLI